MRRRSGQRSEGGAKTKTYNIRIRTVPRRLESINTGTYKFSPQTDKFGRNARSICKSTVKLAEKSEKLALKKARKKRETFMRFPLFVTFVNYTVKCCTRFENSFRCRFVSCKKAYTAVRNSGSACLSAWHSAPSQPCRPFH